MEAPLAGHRLLIVDEDAGLAALVQDAFTRLGAEVVACGGGREALAALARAPFGAALLDLPLSDFRGGEVLRALSAAGVPAIAVSGIFRGPRAADEVRRLGARDFFEKPFDVVELVRAVARTMGVRLPRLGALRDEVTGSFPLQASPARIEAIEAPLPPALDRELPPPTAASPALPMSTPLPEPADVRPAARGADAPPPLMGDLARIAVPRLLVALHQALATGALTITRGPVKKILCVERGVPVYAASNVGAERFASICLRRGLVRPEELEALRREDPAARVGELLVARKVLTAEQRAEIIAGQIKLVVWSTFEWRDGSYELQLARPPDGRVPVTLSMADLILEGMMRACTLERLRAEVDPAAHLAPAPDPAFELYALGLRPAEAHLLSLADGTKSVRDLVALSQLPERETLAFLQACRVMHVLDEVEHVLAGTRRMGFM